MITRPRKLKLAARRSASTTDPADRLISVAFSNVSTTDPAGFYQHTLGGNFAPGCNLIPLYPTLVCDSFVTLGLECDRGASTTDPDFDAAGFNFTGEVSGGWYNSAPSNGQGDPDADGRVMIARFSYKQNKNTSGDVCAFTQLAGSRDIIAFLLQPFDCSIPGGGLPGGGGAGGALCGDPGTGSCFQQNSGTPFCNCLECCDLICSTDPFCCGEDEGDWDSSCQAQACANCDFTACEDCNSNGIFDSCDVDCQGGSPCIVCNDVPGCGESQDCNLNNVPDECDIDPADPDNNGLVSADRNRNGTPDECEDCNNNGILDPCDLDCGVPGGACDVPGCGLSADCNGSGIPDECEDCNFNTIPDPCDLSCGAPGGPCDVPGCGLSDDCNENCVPDECDDVDCNGNGIPDECDISSGTSQDIDSNGSVGPFDLAILLGNWGPNPKHPADLDADGTVGPADLALLLGAWGPCP